MSRKPNKATASNRTTGRRNRHAPVYDDFLVDSDDDSRPPPAMATRHSSRVIEIDCDDLFAGGPEVRIDRDLGAAPACTADDNAALEINVRIGGTTEIYELRRVSEIHEFFQLALDCFSQIIPINSCLSLVPETHRAGRSDCRKEVRAGRPCCVHAPQ